MIMTNSWGCLHSTVLLQSYSFPFLLFLNKRDHCDDRSLKAVILAVATLWTKTLVLMLKIILFILCNM